MKKSKLAELVFLGLLPLTWAGCETARQAFQFQKPSVALKGVSFGDVGLESATLLFDVEVGNPYSAPLPLTNMDYVLTSGSRPMFSGKADIAQTIAARQKAVVTLPATIGYLDMVAAFKGVRPGATIPYKADVKLAMNAPVLGAIGIPVAKEGQVTVPTIPTADSVKAKLLELLKTQ